MGGNVDQLNSKNTKQKLSLEQIKQNLLSLKEFPADVYSNIKYGTLRTKYNQTRNRMRFGHSNMTETDAAMNKMGNELAKAYAGTMASIYMPMFIPVGKGNAADWMFKNLFMPKLGTNAIKWGTQLLGKIPQISSRLGPNIGRFYTGLDAIGEAANTGLLGYWGYRGGKDLYNQATGKKPFSLWDTGWDLFDLGLAPSTIKRTKNHFRDIRNEFSFVKKPGITMSTGTFNLKPAGMVYNNGENPMTIIGEETGEYIPQKGVRLTPKTGNTPVGNKLKSAMFDQEFYGKGPFGVTLKLDESTNVPNIISGNYWKSKIPVITAGITGAAGAWTLGNSLFDSGEDEIGQSDYYPESDYYIEERPEEPIYYPPDYNVPIDNTRPLYR